MNLLAGLWILAATQQFGAVNQPPATLKFAGLTPDFKAYKLAVKGESEDSGVGSFYGVFSMLATRGFMNDSLLMGSSWLSASWTKGETFEAGGHEYLVTYKAEVGIPAGTKLEPLKAMGITLRLVLVRTDMVVSIAPLPDLSISTTMRLAKQEQMLEGDKVIPIDAGNSITAAILFPVIAQAHQAAERTTGLSNVKQLGLAMIMFLNDSDDVFPNVQGTQELHKLLHPYLKNDGIWKTMNPKGSNFYFNMCLSGVADESIKEPTSTPMIYESQPWADGRRNVCFADGYAKALSEDEWERVEPNLHLKLKKAPKKPKPRKGR